MKGKIREWDARYREKAEIGEPSSVVVRAAQLIAPGRALDLACGPGRHTLYLARLGWQVDAVDASHVAIGQLRERAAGLPVNATVADLEAGEFAIPAEAYDLIVDCFYLQRDLLPAIRAGVKPQGLIAAAIHMFDDSPGVKPMNPAYALQPGELRQFFAGWEILHYAEGVNSGGHRRRSAELIARAVRKR